MVGVGVWSCRDILDVTLVLEDNIDSHEPLRLVLQSSVNVTMSCSLGRLHGMSEE